MEPKHVASSLSQMSGDELFKRLKAHAIRVFGEYGFLGSESILPGVAKSPEDYAQKIFVDHVMGRIRDKELAYLCRAVRNDIIDDLRSPTQKLTESRPNLPQQAQDDDRPRISVMDDLIHPGKLVDDLLTEEAYRAHLLSCVDKEPDLKEYLEAIFYLDLTKPGDIASALDIPATEVRARQKKMRRRLVGLGIAQVKR
jgi:DNA-directed RNA polymerase specialized sigma24 family protein